MTQVTPIRDLKGYLELGEVEKVISVATNLRDTLLVRIPWRTGIRVSELIGIKVSDIDFVSRAIVIKVQKMRKRDGKAIDLEAWLDHTTWELGFPKRLADIARKIANGDTLTNKDKCYLYRFRQREQKRLF